MTFRWLGSYVGRDGSVGSLMLAPSERGSSSLKALSVMHACDWPMCNGPASGLSQSLYKPRPKLWSTFENFDFCTWDCTVCRFLYIHTRRFVMNNPVEISPVPS